MFAFEEQPRQTLPEVAAALAEAFDYEVLSEETRHLDDDRHHLVLGYVHDQPAGFAFWSRSSTRTSGANST